MQNNKRHIAEHYTVTESKQEFCENACILMIYWAAGPLVIPSSTSKTAHRIRAELTKTACSIGKSTVWNYNILVQNSANTTIVSKSK